MPQIIPIRDLKNTSEISAMCHSSNEPVFITKNGYGDMVVMSMETYEKNMFIHDIEKSWLKRGGNKQRTSQRCKKSTF